MGIRGVSGNQPYYTSGQVRSSSGSPVECKSVYEAEPSAVIRREEDGIAAKSHYTEKEALWNQYMKQYRLKLEQEGIGNEIDWRGVESDFKKMDVNFDNAGYLNTKINYIASRYAVLKDRIKKTILVTKRNSSYAG